jgi:hypothetical protein
VLPNAPRPEPGIIAGTVIDVNDDAIPGATVRATSTKVGGRRSLAFSTQSPSRLSAGETMGGCSRTTRPSVATSARRPSRMPIIQRRIEVSDCFSGTS